MPSEAKNEEGIRLQKFLSSRGIASRRTVELWITEGRIEVNGRRAILGQRVIGDELIELDGKKLELSSSPTIFILFHKPRGVECTLARVRGRKTLVDFDFGKDRVFPVGRLDKDSRGLVLLTNDGDIAYQLTHPKFDHEKEYIVSVDKVLTNLMLRKLSQGVKIDGKMTRKCQVSKLTEKKFKIILQEGRKRQIRRMCEALGMQVLDLLRIRIDRFELGNLKEGEVLLVDK